MRRENISKTYPDKIAFYKLTLPTGHYYVGSTSFLAKRVRYHRYQLEIQDHYNLLFQSLFDKWSNVSVSYVLCNTIDEARQLEQETINRDLGNGLILNRATDVNSIWGGVHGMSQEHRERLRQLTRKRWEDPNYRDYITEIWAKQRVGRKLSEEHKENIRKAGLGKIHTLESRIKMSESQKGIGLGRKRDPDSVRRGVETMRALGKNRQTPESKARIAEANFKTVVIDGVEYSSMMDAAKAHGITPSGVTYRVNSPSPRFKDWHFK